MHTRNKFEQVIEANCQTILELVHLKGLSLGTLSLLYKHFVSKEIEIDQSSINCSAGCGYCCHLRVTASIAEILVIVDHLQQQGLVDAYRKRLESPAGCVVSPEDFPSEKSSEYWVKNAIPCLFYDQQEQLCKIYDVRPFTCRGYHSLDVKQCQQGYLTKSNCKIPCYPDFKRAQESYSLSFERAMKQVGKQSTQFELTSTVTDLLQCPENIKKWLDGSSILKQTTPSYIS